jgi:hypothetical protein
VWQAFYCVADGNHAALRRTAVLVLLPRVRRPGAHFVFARFLLPPLLWTAASVDTTNHKGQGNRTGRQDSAPPGRKRELAGAVPDQAEGNAAWLKLFSRCEQYERKSLLGLATAIENLSARLSRTK